MKWKNYPFWAWILLMTAGVSVLFIGITIATHSDVDMSQPAAMRWLLTGQDLLVLIIPAFVLACWMSGQPMTYLHLNRGMSALTAVLAILTMLLAAPAINLLSHWNEQLALPQVLQPLEQWMKQLEEQNALTTERLLSVNTLGGLLANLALIGVGAALSEELTFRALLTRFFTPRHSTSKLPHGPIWAVAVVFSLLHFQFYGFIPRMLMGALFGYALAWTGSLWVPILMHFTNNAMSVILYYIIDHREGLEMEQMESLGTGDTLWLGILSLVVTAALIYCLRRSTTINRASSRTSMGN